VPSRHLSIRLEADTFRRLDAQSRRSGQTRSRTAQTLLEEGLRMESHPGVLFRSGPAGRRPGLVGGPDLWEVVRVFRGIESCGEEAVRRTATLTGLSEDQVRVALRYYAALPAEIDAWIARLDEASAEGEATWSRECELLGS
jgi:hypothetical protein